MGLYLRKSFRAGPVRVNLSKSGLGVSGGVKGARISAGPRGTHVHAGRQGLYYRKKLKSGRSRRRTPKKGDALAGLFLYAIAGVVLFGIWLFNWLKENPTILLAGIAVPTGTSLFLWSARLRRKRAVSDYKEILDSTFVTAQSQPAAAALASVKRQQESLPKNAASKGAVEKIEADVYQAVLDTVLDDGFITKEEAATIAAAEGVLGISPAVRLRIKIEIFSAALVEAIEDSKITQDELDKILNLMDGLSIPQSEVQRELDIVKDIIDAQALCLPFKNIPPDQLVAPIQKSEDAFFQCSAQIFTKKKSKKSPSGYEYTLKRDGTMILTNKRLFVVGKGKTGAGTTKVRFTDIGDLDFDLDEGVIELSKVGSGRPIILKTDTPIFMGRAIELLMTAKTEGNPA